MTQARVAVLFPGQGAYYPGALTGLTHGHPAVQQVLAAMDPIAHKHLGGTLSDYLASPSPPENEVHTLRAQGLYQLAIYGSSLAVYRTLESQGLVPQVFVGHSFGELTAMVCAGGFTVEEGTELLCERVAALQKLGSHSGFMAALGMDAERTNHLVQLIGSADLAIAAENHAGQTALSGSEEAMALAQSVCGPLRIAFKKLNSIYPFHCPSVMKPAAEDFRARLRRFTSRPLKAPVFSPILGRYYHAQDSLTGHLADHLMQTVHFTHALHALADEGITVFIECGASKALSSFAKSELESTPVLTMTLLHSRTPAPESLATGLQVLREQLVLPHGSVG
ncbi:ACP S-malonyltransferase [Stigmatella aurantiaca]|uniref:Acyl transferase domain protein n=1 Tax=Stigmatella aurantiaca (strain DW4/3-1) TaxID=378806 RepID=Q091L1_STIAD|nr:acyltransferase domain-containing protein [Stigmatella aurantiaca]ADO68879.1 Acyl transferase domain protein [Stigmatella aurantiaca DW4/3-1]EAU66418.1 acyl transferase domain protein [Stigmatella aurantiaca DW4/3-1]